MPPKESDSTSPQKPSQNLSEHPQPTKPGLANSPSISLVPILRWLLMGMLVAMVAGIPLLAPTNPDFTLPGSLEFATMGCLLFLFVLVLPKRASLTISVTEFAGIALAWGITVFVTGPRALWPLYANKSINYIPCRTLGDLGQTAECFLQAAINQHYGPRTYFMLVTALALGTIAFALARVSLLGFRLVLGIILGGALFVTLSSLAVAWFHLPALLPAALGIPENDVSRMTAIFTNPSWYWPYMAPALSTSLAIAVYAKGRSGLWFATITAILLAIGILQNQQRGGLLLLTAMGVFVVGSILVSAVRQRNLRLGLLLGPPLFAMLVAPIAWFLLTPQPSFTLGSLAFSWKSLTLDVPRLKLWQSAWFAFRENPIWGHGYASWFQIALDGNAADQSAPVFDTAHNLVVQMLAELGSLHTLGIVAVAVLLLAGPLRNPSRRSLPVMISATVAAAIVSVVQEIDYIRPTFYVHAILWGAVLGHAQQQGTKNFTVTFSPHHRILCTLAGLGALTIALLCLVYFTWGGSAFEADLRNRGPLARWLGPYARIPIRQHSGKEFALATLTPLSDADLSRLSGVTTSGGGAIVVPLHASSRMLPKINTFTFDAQVNNATRVISARLHYPFVWSHLALQPVSGLHAPEISQGRVSWWCARECRFTAESCGEREVRFLLSLPRPDLKDADRLSISITAENVYDVLMWSQKTELSRLRTESIIVPKQSDKPGERITITIKGSSAFIPSSTSFGPDNRELSFMIQETPCR